MDARSLASEIEHHLATAQIDLALKSDGNSLRIAGHSPILWLDGAGTYEEAAVLLLDFLIRKFRPKTFFDVGAGSGVFARVAASCVEAPPAVHTFEVRPEWHARLIECANRDGLNKLITAHLAGLSDHHDGEVDAWIVRTRLFDHEPTRQEHLEAWWRRLKFFLRGVNRGPVKTRLLVTSIDHLASQHGIVPDLLKIDVDGYEDKVLLGGMQTIRAHKPVIALELHKNKIMSFSTRRDVVRQLLDVGYRALFLTDHHDRKVCRVVPVDLAHPLVSREETDFVLFY